MKGDIRMAVKSGKKESRKERKEMEHKENREHWLAEEEKIYDLWERGANPGGQKLIDRLAKQGKKPVTFVIRLPAKGSQAIKTLQTPQRSYS
jgi:hypothetical protein